MGTKDSWRAWSPGARVKAKYFGGEVVTGMIAKPEQAGWTPDSRKGKRTVPVAIDGEVDTGGHPWIESFKPRKLTALEVERPTV